MIFELCYIEAAPEPPRSDYYRQRFGGGCFCMSAISAEIALGKECPADNLQIATRNLQNKHAHRRLALVNHTNFIKAMYFSLIVSGGGAGFYCYFCQTRLRNVATHDIQRQLVSKRRRPCVDIKNKRKFARTPVCTASPGPTCLAPRRK